jgi:ABC-type sugar transport system ATPase subunit
MIGGTILFGERKTFQEPSTIALEAVDLSREGSFANVSFKLHEGEILGFAGLEGSGRFALGRAVFGIDPYDSGRILIRSREARIRNPRDAIKNRIGFISRYRKEEGIFHKMDLTKNISMVITTQDKRLNPFKYEQIARKFVDMLRIKCSSIRQMIMGLSGGNQQKSIVARWLASEPRIIVMEEPAHGIDVGAKAEMFRIIKEMAQNGTSIMFISSELDELMNECDRIVIMNRGRIADEVIPASTSKEEIMAMATAVLEGQEEAGSRG